MRGCALVLTGRHEPVESERPQRPQHAVPRGPLEVGLDHGGVDEAGQDAAGIRLHVQVCRDPLGRVEVDAVGEDRQMPEGSPLVLGEQLVGPLDGRPQRPVPGVSAG
jgi:hypothetical protein